MNKLYANRKLAEGYPHIGQLSVQEFGARLDKKDDPTPRIKRLITYLSRIVEIQPNACVVDVGCGPRAQTLQALLGLNFNGVGVEPMSLFLEEASKHIKDSSRLLQGSAESIPIPDKTADIVLLEGVLEHVDSPRKSLEEIYRILAPGGVVYIHTTNRYRISLTGENGEFNIPFYNWFPNILKESYVFQQLHYKPAIAGYTQRPAVHWFSFADLCDLGRDVGFAQFYSLMDLMHPDDPTIENSRFRKFVLARIKYSPVLRALALIHVGATIIMYKRK